MSISPACARRSATSVSSTSPCAHCASAKATHTARQSLRRLVSEKSERSSALPYLHENGEA